MRISLNRRSVTPHSAAMRLALASAVALACPASGQTPPTLVSPEIGVDRAVTFRLWAPSASAVELSGNWMGARPPAPLAKGADGVWTVTIPPLEPNIYSYGFIVEGIRTADPSCRCTFASAGRFVDSVLRIPGDTPRAWEAQNSPAGTLHHERFRSARQQRTRQFVVYTPPGYEPAGTRRYPVLVLLPGTPGDENDWTSGGGFAEVMFDNLIARGEMVPMFVVMHASDALDRPGGRRSDQNLQEFEVILVDEVLPLLRARYRVDPQPESWAIAGLSLGGEFGMHVGLKHPEIFRSIGSLSGSLVQNSFDSRFVPWFTTPEARRGAYSLIWLGCGSEDVFLDGTKAFAARLEAAGIKHVFRQLNGPHSLAVARLELAELLPLLFKPPAAPRR
ncbi:Carbohydrate acetyl esterase/feruloyl esterase precursor [Luteitalea pratensis]|uniref:Carbohydrate acetyl esterase/feruloyl esterase n=1 Tax=Luteitalea pratensis TaxID=1855912 RepID=A0A143PGV2_LUTPR|nr:esterase [Luteitalea pratensis]AMY06994.1 Carbohydrate acetyl esterase/feruloyl esterase precursor [Luteitalea pratensis]